MNRSNYRASWRFLEYLTKSSSIVVRAKSCSLVCHLYFLPQPPLRLHSNLDPNGAPRAVINSKGRRRRPGTKTLAQVLRCSDEEFVDFVSKCLVWDPERRIKPQAAVRHPFVIAGRRQKLPSSSTKATPSSLSGSRSKQLNETPKKSLISAPTPLTARSSRMATAGGPTTPSNAHASALGSSSRSYRMSQSQGLSSYSSRTLNGFAVRHD